MTTEKQLIQTYTKLIRDMGYKYVMTREDRESLEGMCKRLLRAAPVGPYDDRPEYYVKDKNKV
jgi:hypothetical protein